MPDFTVTFTVRLEIAATMTIKAKDEGAAGDKAETLINQSKIGIGSWTGIETKGLEIEYEETDQEIEIESVDEE